LVRTPFEEASTPIGEEVGISLCQQARIGRGRRAAEMDRSGECLRQMRFELAQLRPRKHRIVDAVFHEPMRVRDTLEQGLLGVSRRPMSCPGSATARTRCCSSAFSPMPMRTVIASGSITRACRSTGCIVRCTIITAIGGGSSPGDRPSMARLRLAGTRSLVTGASGEADGFRPIARRTVTAGVAWRPPRHDGHRICRPRRRQDRLLKVRQSSGYPDIDHRIEEIAAAVGRFRPCRCGSKGSP
jgi:hypothetical protein